MSAHALSLRAFGVRVGRRTILKDLDLDVPERGVLALMGPVGAGKSTLLRTICQAHPERAPVEVRGSATWLGRPLSAQDRPLLVAQSARDMLAAVGDYMSDGMPDRASLLVAEQRERAAALLGEGGLGHLADRLDRSVLDLSTVERRLLAIAQSLSSDPAMICVDEPTAGLEDDERDAVAEVLRAQGRTRAVLVVTHHQRFARRVSDRVALLAGGRIIEATRTEAFFAGPATDSGRRFVRTGGCPDPCPDTPPEHLAPEFRPRVDQPPVDAGRTPRASAGVPEARSAPSPQRGPRGFQWVLPGLLGGCPQPGLLRDLDADLAALARVGTTVLVTLTEEPTVPVEPAAAQGIRVVHFPIVDMEAPAVAAAEAFCERVRGWLEGGEVVVVHCRAGLGRTGTMLAAQLVHYGQGPEEALTAVRAREGQYVQSAAQELFLARLAHHLAPGIPGTGASVIPRSGVGRA